MDWIPEAINRHFIVLPFVVAGHVFFPGAVRHHRAAAIFDRGTTFFRPKIRHGFILFGADESRSPHAGTGGITRTEGQVFVVETFGMLAFLLAFLRLSIPGEAEFRLVVFAAIDKTGIADTDLAVRGGTLAAAYAGFVE